MTAKYLADSILGHCLLDTARLETVLTEGLSLLRESPFGTLVVMSPLPCLDPMTMRYRNEIGTIMELSANAVGAVYLNLLDGSWWSPEFHWDHMHLGARGHARLAEEIDRTLLGIRLWCAVIPSGT
jgi:hypothetical protein